MKQALLFWFLLFTLQSFGQVEEGFQIRGTIIPLGLSTEFQLNETKTLAFVGGLQPYYRFESIEINGERNTNSHFNFRLGFNPTYRNYYNFQKREEAGKKTSGNSANYYGFSYSYTGKALETDINDLQDSSSFHHLGAVWGLQRTYDSNIFLDLNIGAGYRREVNDLSPLQESTGVGTFGNFSLGYSFN